MELTLKTVLLDSHVLHWWSAEPERLSLAAVKAMDDADELGAAAITWLELAWLARHERIVVSIPIRTWLDQLAAQVRTIGITPSIASTAVELPASFPRDPADRLIVATAIEHGWRLITKDNGILAHQHPRPLAIW